MKKYLTLSFVVAVLLSVRKMLYRGSLIACFLYGCVLTLSAQTRLLGLAAEGGTYDGGTMFQINPDGTGLTALYNFQSSSGNFPIGSLIQAQNGLLYGVSKSGGASGFGTIFQIKPDGTNHLVLFNFTNETGYPAGSLLQTHDGVLFGVTTHGDAGFGTAYKVNTDGSGYSEVYRFTAESGYHEPGFLTQASNGMIYGTTYSGGTYLYGQVFRMNPDGSEPFVMQHFSWEDVESPYGALIQANDGALYGVGNQGGHGGGTIYRMLPDASVVSMIHYFDLNEVGYPAGSLTQAPDGALYGMTTAGGPNNFGSLYKINPDKSGFTVLQYFNGYNGKSPVGNLVYYDNKLYGYTTTGGAYQNESQSGYGAIVSYDLSTGIYTKVADLGGSTGESPMFGGLLLLNPTSAVSPTVAASSVGFTNVKNHSMKVSFSPGDGMDHLVVMKTGSAPTFTPENDKLYFGDVGDGTTVVYNGKATTVDLTGLAPGSTHYFAVFEYNTNYAGNIRYLTSGPPRAAKATSAYSETVTKMVGVTRAEGRSDAGTLYSMNTDGTDFTVLYNFKATAGHQIGTLFTAKDGDLYGVSKSGGAHAFGSLYKIKSNGTGYTVIYNFTRNDGYPSGSPLQTEDGTIFGVSAHDDAHYGMVYKINPDGSGHEELYRFTMAIGYRQPGYVMQASNGLIYVTTYAGGSNGLGMILRMNPDGSGPVVVHDFAGESDGYFAYSKLTEITGGRLYGVAHLGGDEGAGVLYRIEADGSGFTVVHSFNYSDGGFPCGALTQTPDGTLYGLTIVGGQYGLGTLYKLHPDGTGFEVIQHYNRENGDAPLGDLTLYDTKLYGYTAGGGIYSGGTLFYHDPGTATYHKLIDLNAAMGVGPAFGSLLPVPPRQRVDGVQNFSVVDVRTGVKLLDFDKAVSLDVGDPDFYYWTIRANTQPDKIGSVVFKLDGLKKNVDNKSPYLFYRHYLHGQQPTSHILIAEAYSKHSGKGARLQSKVALINFVNKTTVTGFEIVDATGEKIQDLNDGDILNLEDPRLINFNIIALLDQDAIKTSVKFYLNGEPYRTDNHPPYNMISWNHKWWDEPGLYSVSAVPFSLKNATGMPGIPATVNFFISDEHSIDLIALTADYLSDSVRDEEAARVNIYPVPAQHDLNISTDDHGRDEGAQIIIWNMMGEVHFDEVVQLTDKPYTVDLEQLGLLKGIYFIRITRQGAVDVFRFLKE